MSTASVSLLARERGNVARLVAAGATVGVLDISAAIVVYAVVLHKTTAERVLQSVASGLLGPASYSGGAATAALGLFLHFAIAFGWATAYYLLVRRWSALGRAVSPTSGAVKVGIAVGTFVVLAMNLVIVPLSSARAAPPLSRAFLIQLVIHWLCVGLPIVLIVRDGRGR
jgi:hypothetical protein